LEEALEEEKFMNADLKKQVLEQKRMLNNVMDEEDQYQERYEQPEEDSDDGLDFFKK
jgi:hypothetical protein